MGLLLLHHPLCHIPSKSEWGVYETRISDQCQVASNLSKVLEAKEEKMHFYDGDMVRKTNTFQALKTITLNTTDLKEAPSKAMGLQHLISTAGEQPCCTWPGVAWRAWGRCRCTAAGRSSCRSRGRAGRLV
ncbi:unnamed protein product [Musa acuminata subsp. burmannicoides]